MKEELVKTQDRDSEAKTTDTDDTVGGRFRWFVISLFVGSLVLFISIYVEGLRDHFINRFSNIYLVIPLLGGLFGMMRLNKVRRLYEVRRLVRDTYLIAVALFCLGLVLWSIGCMIWMFLIFRYPEDQIPYPSLADAFYALCFLCWTAGIIYLYERSGKNVLHELNSSVAKFLVPVWGGIVTVVYLSHAARLTADSPSKDLLKFGLDMFFPIVDLFNLSLFITLLPGPGNEKLHIQGKPLRIIVIGYFFLCLASSSFTISSSLPENSPYHYYNGGFSDVMFAAAFTVLSIGISLIPLGQISRTRRIGS